MRTYDNENVESARPRGDRAAEESSEQLGRAAAEGRPDVLGLSGLLALQRVAGNAGVTAMMAAEESPDEAPDASEASASPVHDVIGSGGSPLDQHVRSDMESRFGQDFGDVRVHTGPDAHASAAGLSAQAYTVGSDIVFSEGRYDPASEPGAHMLAHELTHVVQQRSGPVDGTDVGDGVRVSDPSDTFERAASANADHVMSAAPPAQRIAEDSLEAQTYAGAASVQRDEMDGELEEPPA